MGPAEVELVGDPEDADVGANYEQKFEGPEAVMEGGAAAEPGGDGQEHSQVEEEQGETHAEDSWGAETSRAATWLIVAVQNPREAFEKRLQGVHKEDGDKNPEEVKKHIGKFGEVLGGEATSAAEAAEGLAEGLACTAEGRTH